MARIVRPKRCCTLVGAFPFPPWFDHPTAPAPAVRGLREKEITEDGRTPARRSKNTSPALTVRVLTLIIASVQEGDERVPRFRMAPIIIVPTPTWTDGHPGERA